MGDQLKHLRNLVTVASLALAMTGVSTAQERIGAFVLLPEKNAVKLEGPIALETSLDFDAVLAKMPNIQTLELNSPGGNVMSALEIANKVSALAISTQIDISQNCASACSMIFLAGKSRQATGKLGVHQLSSRGEGSLVAVQFVISNILDAFQKFGVDSRVTKYMLTTPMSDMYYFSDFEKDDYRINRKEEAKPISITNDNNTLELKFTDYPAKEILKSTIKLPDFRKDEHARMYRTRIREGMKAGPNFAGHYSLIEIGCGTSCRFGILVDANSGKRIEFPLGGEENYQLELTYTVESSLLKAVWMDTANDKYDTCVKQDYQLDGDKMLLLGGIRYTIVEYGICSTYQ